MSGTLADVHPPYLYPEYKSTRLRAPAQPPVRVAPSPLEAAGPTFPKSFVRDSEADLTTWGKSAPLGEKMVLVGRVLDDAGRPVPDCLVEIWHANCSGKYIHHNDPSPVPEDANFPGRGRVMTDAKGCYEFRTIKPGAYAVPDSQPGQQRGWWRPPHIHLSLFGANFASRLVTQLYFPGDPLNEQDAKLRTDEANDTGVIVYSPIHSGLLSGTFDPTRLAPGDWRLGIEVREVLQNAEGVRHERSFDLDLKRGGIDAFYENVEAHLMRIRIGLIEIDNAAFLYFLYRLRLSLYA